MKSRFADPTKNDWMIDVLSTIINLVPHEVFAKDSCGNFILSHEAHAKSYRLLPQEVLGRNELDLSPHADEAEKFHRDDQEIIQSGEPKHISHEVFTDPDGNLISLQTTKLPLPLSQGTEIGVLGVAVDETEQKIAELSARALPGSQPDLHIVI